MKKMIALGLFALTLLMTACSDKPVAAEQLPEPIKAFVKQYFPQQTISYAKKDFELFGTKYEVTLDDATQVDFENDHVWDKVERMAAPVPDALIPGFITTHVRTKFPDAMIVKIDKERSGYEVELSNSMELKFDEHGALTDIDD